jgi:hypothetical protein
MGELNVLVFNPFVRSPDLLTPLQSFFFRRRFGALVTFFSSFFPAFNEQIVITKNDSRPDKAFDLNNLGLLIRLLLIREDGGAVSFSRCHHVWG